MLWGLAWYWWVLIAIGVATIGYLKVRVFNSMMQKRRQKMAEDKEDF